MNRSLFFAIAAFAVLAALVFVKSSKKESYNGYIYDSYPDPYFYTDAPIIVSSDPNGIMPAGTSSFGPGPTGYATLSNTGPTRGVNGRVVGFLDPFWCAGDYGCGSVGPIGYPIVDRIRSKYVGHRYRKRRRNR